MRFQRLNRILNRNLSRSLNPSLNPSLFLRDVIRLSRILYVKENVEISGIGLGSSTAQISPPQDPRVRYPGWVHQA